MLLQSPVLLPGVSLEAPLGLLNDTSWGSFEGISSQTGCSSRCATIPTPLPQLRALEQAGMVAGLGSMPEPFQINIRSLGRLRQ